MSKPKLPKVWVGFKNADQALDGAYFKLPWRGFDGVTRFRLYAPVQKPKECDGHPAYRQAARDNGFKFCPYCSGKIKVKK